MFLARPERFRALQRARKVARTKRRPCARRAARSINRAPDTRSFHSSRALLPLLSRSVAAPLAPSSLRRHAAAPPGSVGLPRRPRTRPSGAFSIEIRSDDMRLGLETFNTAKQAARAYDAAAWRLRRPRREMNFPNVMMREVAENLAPRPCLVTDEDHCRNLRRERRLGIAETDEAAMEAWHQSFPQDVVDKRAFFLVGAGDHAPERGEVRANPTSRSAAMETLLSPSALLGPLRGSRKLAAPAAVPCSRSAVSCSLKKQTQTQAGVAWRGDGGVGSWASFLHHGLAAAALSLALTLSPAPAPAVASEFDVLNDGPPADTYVVDDAGVLSRVTKSDVKRLARDLEARKNIRINFVTVRKLTSKADAFEYADQVLEKWYPTVEEGSNKGIVVLVTSQKEGAITGGPAFVQAIGDAILDATVSENLPVLATDEKYNEAIFSTAKRLVAAIDGLPDPGGPAFQESKRESNFKSKEETDEKRGQFTLVVGGLLVIAFVVPMAQYYAYISKK